MKEKDIEVLKHFLEYPIWTSKPIFDKFKTIQNAIFREHNAKGKERFLFVNGTKESKVVLVAHADTVFDVFYNEPIQKHFIEIENVKECYYCIMCGNLTTVPDYIHSWTDEHICENCISKCEQCEKCKKWDEEIRNGLCGICGDF